MFIGPLLVQFAVILAFVSTSNVNLTVSKVYVIYAILNIIRMPFAIVPLAISAIAEMLISLNRLTKFFHLEEIEPVLCLTAPDKTSTSEALVVKDLKDTVGLVSSIDSSGDKVNKKVIVWIDHGDFSWGVPLSHRTSTTTSSGTNNNNNLPLKDGKDMAIVKGGDDDVVSVSDPAQKTSLALQDVNLTIYDGEFIAVVGVVGSGKSTLLSAILGQVQRVRGTQSLDGRVAYVCQENWIQNRSLRDNILFDSPYDENKYHQVLSASQLTRDLSALPSSDGTEIGERGINLSGGQKARVSVARALYADDISLYIFDDPLSAVDAHVGKAIFENALVNMLQGRCRLVVLSSNYHLLPRFDKIIVIQNGKIVAFDHYNEIIQNFPEYKAADDSDVSEDSNVQAEDHPEEVVGNSIELDSDATTTTTLSVSEGVTEVNQDTVGLEVDVKEAVAANEESSATTKHNNRVKFPINNTNIKPLNAKDRQLIGKSYKFRDNIGHVEDDDVDVEDGDEGEESKKENENPSPKQPANKMMSEEDRERGAVSGMTYMTYVASAASGVKGGVVTKALVILSVLLVVFSFGQAVRVLADIWVGIWAADRDGARDKTNSFYIQWYIVIVVGTTVISIGRAIMYIAVAIASSKNMHFTALQAVLRAPINLYFDITPMGRILNRFSKDLDAIDSLLPDNIMQSLQNGLTVISILVLCIISSYYFVIILFPIAALFIYIHGFFRKSSREIKRLEGVSRSPVYSLFEEVLQGLSTIRAFGRQQQLMDKHYLMVDSNSRCYFLFWMASRWLALRLDIVSSLVVLSVALLSVIAVDTGGAIDPSVFGLALVYSLQLTGLLQWTVRMFVEMENNMTAVERLSAFSKIPSEAANELKSDPNQHEWPTVGKVEICNLSMRYRPGLPLVLKSLSAFIPGGSKVGICGRTGSGKSSLMLALFRLVEPEAGSSIYVDDVDIMGIGLRALRSSLTIIPQDPVMFSGTLRYNLDPFHQYTDDDIWTALERAQLKNDIISKFSDKLLHMVSEKGENVSVGQRQLICIARALLRRSKVIVMDEVNLFIYIQYYSSSNNNMI